MELAGSYPNPSAVEDSAASLLYCAEPWGEDEEGEPCHAYSTTNSLEPTKAFGLMRLSFWFPLRNLRKEK